MNGKYDDNINEMIKGFNKLGRPVWLRIGYEFNGQWTYFNQTCYKGAYQRITKALRNDKFCNNSCATVWDYTADSECVGMFMFIHDKLYTINSTKISTHKLNHKSNHIQAHLCHGIPVMIM